MDPPLKLASGGFGQSQGTFFAESSLVLLVLSSLLDPSTPVLVSPPSPSSRGRTVETTEAKVEYLTRTLDLYLEQPHLLDQHLEEMMGLLVGHCLGIILPLFGSSSSPSSPSSLPSAFSPLHPCLKVVHSLAKVRGYKAVRNLFSHEVSHLEPVLRAVVHLDEPRRDGGGGGGTTTTPRDCWPRQPRGPLGEQVLPPSLAELPLPGPF